MIHSPHPILHSKSLPRWVVNQVWSPHVTKAPISYSISLLSTAFFMQGYLGLNTERETLAACSLCLKRISQVPMQLHPCFMSLLKCLLNKSLSGHPIPD